MRTTLLNIKADLENCTNLKPLDHEEYAHDYGFQVQCTRCDFIHPKEVLINRFDRIPIKLTKVLGGPIARLGNFATYCKDCRNNFYIILTSSGRGLMPNLGLATILEIHCHGCKVIAFSVQDQFQCTTNSDEILDGVDLRQSEWTQFDCVSAVPVTITNFCYELEELPGNGLITTLT